VEERKVNDQGNYGENTDRGTGEDAQALEAQFATAVRTGTLKRFPLP